MVKSQTSLRFYGGVNEIGGNKILVHDRDTMIFLDFGMSYANKRKFYSPPFLSPKTEKSLQQLNILPELKGVYTFDSSPPEIDAVFLSHSHMDHSAYLSFVNRKIPVYCGDTTRIILEAQGEMRRADLEFNIEGLCFETFRTHRNVKIGGIEIEPVHVDHSVPGAYGFVIHTSNGSIVYTGDFRMHGAKPEMTADFVESAKQAEPVALISEATNMIGATVSSEAEIESKLDSIVKQATGIVLAEFSYADVDRLNSFYSTAKENDRCLAVSLKQAGLLKALSKDSGLSVPDLNDDNLLIFRKSKKTNDRWEKQLITEFSHKIVDGFETSKRQCKMILALSFYDLEELVEIQPEAGSCYVLSASEPFNEEMEIDYDRLRNWLTHYGLPQYHVHVSGHIMPLQLKSVLGGIGAKTVFPIHTEDAQLMTKFLRDLKSKIILTEKEKEYVI